VCACACACVCLCVRVCVDACVRVRVCVAHIVSCGVVLGGGLDGVGQETEDGAGPQQDGETSEQLATELDPLWGGGGRGKRVGTIPDQELSCLGSGQSL